MESATSDSKAIICWVLNAIVAESSVGRPNASSNEFVCNDCVPPKTAASACIETRTTLFNGC